MMEDADPSPLEARAVEFDDFDDLFSVWGALGSCATRNRSRSIWPPRCRSPITFTMSLNWMGLACVGTVISNSKLATVASDRKMGVLILVRQLPPQSLQGRRSKLFFA